MNRAVMAMVMIGAAAGGAVMVAAQAGAPPPPPQEGIPGRGTQARVYVLNRDKTDAVPVTIIAADPIRTSLAGTATVRIDPETSSSVKATAARQAWEYRTLPVSAGSSDPTSTLNGAGADGWELVGTMPAPGGATLLLLKRPR